jgi:hypothetical protein
MDAWSLSSGGDLHTVLPDGSGIQALTTTPGVEEAQAAWSPDGSRDRHNSQPAWSPDGRQIVFRRSVPGNDLSADIWIMGADGSAPHALSSSGAQGAKAQRVSSPRCRGSPLKHGPAGVVPTAAWAVTWPWSANGSAPAATASVGNPLRAIEFWREWPP